MARISDVELERLKREVSLERLVPGHSGCDKFTLRAGRRAVRQQADRSDRASRERARR